MKGYVYLILEVDIEGNERHKIGISKNHPDKRVKALQTGNSNKIRTLKYYESIYYKKIEYVLHKEFKFKQTEAKNEWFKLTDDDIANFIQSCEKHEKNFKIIEEYNTYVSKI